MQDLAQMINPNTFRRLHLHVDEDGYLLDTAEWSRELAAAVAEAAGLGELGSMHWQMIAFIRDTYEACGAPPSIHQLCRRLHMDRLQVEHAFGSCRNLWQIAGLPNPGEEMRTYLV